MNPARKRWTIDTALIAGILLFLYLVLPIVLLQQINRRLQQVPGYSGEIKRLSLGWVRGRVILHGVRFAKDEKTAPGAVIAADKVIADVSWMQLLRGRVVVDLDIDKGDMLFLMRERRIGQTRPQGVWKKPFEKVYPFRVDRIAFHDGILRFKNEDAIPPIDVYFDQVNLTATHLATHSHVIRSTHTHVEATARMQNQAPLTLTMNVDSFNEHAVFDMKGSLKQFDLVAMNSIMKHYTGLQLEKGALNMEVDLFTREGRFGGKVKRWIEGLAIQKSDDKLFKRIKEDVAQTWINWQKDDKTGRIEKDFEYAGPLGYLDQDIVLAAVWIAKGAFIQSLKAKLDDQVHPGDPAQALDEWALFQEKEREKSQKLSHH